jgi:hypothetical protein
MNSPYPKPPTPVRGREEYESEYHGLKVFVTYDLDGVYIPATADEPAELPDVLIRSVSIGGGENAYDYNAQVWDELLDLTADIEQQRARDGVR